MKPLKTIEEHNAERRAIRDFLEGTRSRGCGIACPDCGKEMRETNPGEVLTSNPPKKHIRCSCGFKTTVLA